MIRIPQYFFFFVALWSAVARVSSVNPQLSSIPGGCFLHTQRDILLLHAALTTLRTDLHPDLTFRRKLEALVLTWTGVVRGQRLCLKLQLSEQTHEGVKAQFNISVFVRFVPLPN